MTAMGPEDAIRKRRTVEAAADLLEWATDVAEEIKKRRKEKDEESWIDPDSLDLQDRALIAQVLSAASLGVMASSGELGHVTRARNELAEVARRVSGQDAARPLTPSRQALSELQATLKRLSAEPAAPGVGPDAVAEASHYVLSVWHGPRGFSVKYTAAHAPLGKPIVCGDETLVLKAVEEMLLMFKTVTEGGGKKA